MGFNAPETKSLSRKKTDRAWRTVEQSALKLMAADISLTKAYAIQQVLQNSGKERT